ncbi:hypothetical protein F2Q69_00063224 [Brassica cretica]|uniref:Uncharacterized protein n=1 Tax=Brassica cretica TaxID=69181 RepID=A0A8S9RCH4_BRACR|nr:hypothetical protein F2Q69_00063224 [Brassica cretica]
MPSPKRVCDHVFELLLKTTWKTKTHHTPLTRTLRAASSIERLYSNAEASSGVGEAPPFPSPSKP